MSWKSNREQITVKEAHDLGLTHVTANAFVTATPSRRSVVVEDPEPTGFVKTKRGWEVHLYDGFMAGQFARRPVSEAIPYESWRMK